MTLAKAKFHQNSQYRNPFDIEQRYYYKILLSSCFNDFPKILINSLTNAPRPPLDGRRRKLLPQMCTIRCKQLP